MMLRPVKLAVVLLLGFVLAWQGVFTVSAGVYQNARGTKSSCCCTGCDSARCATPACCARPSQPSPSPAPVPPSVSQNELQALAVSAALFLTLPSLKAADPRGRSAALNAEAVRTWEDPIAMFGGSVYSSRGFDPSEDGNLAYGVEQKLPLWGRPKLTRRVAQAETSMRESEVNYRARQLRSEITKALVVTALAERVVEIGEQDVAG